MLRHTCLRACLRAQRSGGIAINQKQRTRSPSLRGTLADLGVAEVLTLLSSSSATGRLTVTAADVPRTIDVVDGALVGATGVDTRPAGEGKVKERVAEVMLDLILLEDAPFEFESRSAESIEAVEGESFEVAEILEDIDRRLDEWREIATVIPSTSVIAVLAAELPPESAPLTLDQHEWQIIAALDGTRTVGDVMLVTGMGAFETCGVLHRLANIGAVEVHD